MAAVNVTKSDNWQCTDIRPELDFNAVFTRGAVPSPTTASAPGTR